MTYIARVYYGCGVFVVHPSGILYLHWLHLFSRHCHEDSMEDKEEKEELHEDNQDLKSNLTNLRKKIGLI